MTALNEDSMIRGSDHKRADVLDTLDLIATEQIHLRWYCGGNVRLF